MHIAHLWHQLRQSFWFVPSLITIGAAVLSQITLRLDETFPWSKYNGLGWIYSGSGEGAGILLSAIVGSMITATSITFSMTLVALTLTASQYGPRLLQNFMRRPGSQIVLGTFLATFIFSLLVLRSVQINGEAAVIPHLSVTVAVGLTIASVGVLIFFIHHIAKAIQADTIIGQVYADLLDSIDRMFPEQIGEGRSTDRDHQPVRIVPDEASLHRYRHEGVPVHSASTGYLQAIDAEGLLELAVEHHLVILLHRRPGHFIIQNQRIATLCPSQHDNLNESSMHVCDLLILGQERTSEQDVEFAILQLVEIAVRALSPGINDPHTAMRCLDWLGAALCRISERRLPDPHRYDSQGNIRVIAERAAPAGLVDVAFHQIRQASAGKPALLIRLLESLASIAAQVQDRSMLEALQRHADMILRESRHSVPELLDRADIERHYRDILDYFRRREERLMLGPTTS
ncbi:MAG: hypothetical protein Nkreftii_002173 [Candidatus Nitrospira kreftii]|uniref:DUF2254 domain-containing protein n=1 Tax=Candidatus Nitrospira kreftii TaxID=2652173 RepID=A0A7S8FE56_9BACT|nr:MAG: hypothetical protein Nkreftii_002173 [Candidatus Nitrospira kreftii]